MYDGTSWKELNEVWISLKDMDLGRMESITVKALHRKAFQWEHMDKPALALMIGKRDSMDGQQKFLNYKEEFENPQKLFENEMDRVADTLKVSTDIIPFIRAEYGEALIPSMFGAELVVRDDATPWIKPLISDLHMVNDLEVPDMNQGIMPKTVEAVKYFLNNAPEEVYVCPPYAISPFGLAALLRGSAFYMDLYEHPGLAHKLLSLLTKALISSLKYLKKIMNQPYDEDVCNGIFIPGLLVGDDSCVNISPEMIKEYDIPYLRQVSEALNCKLVVHFCSNSSTPMDKYMPVFAPEETIIGISTQLGLSYYQSDFEEIREQRCAIKTGYCGSFQEAYRGRSFGEWAKGFVGRFRNEWHSGLILNAYVPTAGEAAEMWDVWRKL